MERLALSLGPAYNGPIRSGDTGPLVSNLISVLLVISGIIILFTFILAGISMIKGAGTKNPEEIAKGKKAMTYAVIGFVVMLTSFWIIQFIEIVANNDFITNSPL